MYSAERYPAFMAKVPVLDEPHERLKWARERAGFDDASAAARRFGWNENTYRSHENGARGLRLAAPEYAKCFKVTVGWLLVGEGALTPPIDPELSTLWSHLTEAQRAAVKEIMRQMGRAA